VVRRQSLDRIRVMSLRECRFRAQASETLGHARSECGASLVEFALSVMVMLTFILGVMTMCMALYSYHFVAEAAREGARYAIVRGSGCTTYSGFTSNCPISTAAPIQTYVRSLALPGINANNLTVAAVYSAYPSGTCTPSAACNNPGNQVQVTVTYQLPVTIPFVPARTLTMTSRSQMIIAD
jgi:Flp pilus assembly protein TadG